MVTKLLNAIRKRHRENGVINELYAMSDKDLADIGLSRCDIVRVVRNGITKA